MSRNTNDYPAGVLLVIDNDNNMEVLHKMRMIQQIESEDSTMWTKVSVHDFPA